MSEWDQTGMPSPSAPPPGWDTGEPADPAWQERTLRGLAKGQVVFGRYRLERMLGHGGMGVVWLAEDGELKQPVALKFLPESVMFDPVALDDLRAETRRSLRLTHPNIVRVYHFERESARPLAAISMEFIDGQTLSSLRMERPNRVFEVLDLVPWVQQLSAGLDYAHSQGMVHRDLKPANLMVDAAGKLKVCDFGIACSLRDSITRATGRLPSGSGTLVYMSPQQAMGESPSMSDDIYSVGATIYELLTGRPPFYSGNVQRQIEEKVPPPMALRRAELGVMGEPIPPHWEALVAACLTKEAGRRPGAAVEVVARLRARDQRLEGATPAKQESNLERLGQAANVLGGEGRPPRGEVERVPAEHGTGKAGTRVDTFRLVLALAVAAVWWFGSEALRREAEGRNLNSKEPERGKGAVIAPAVADEKLAAAEQDRQRQAELTGTVRIESEPAGAAVVWTDGRRLGVTPLKLSKVPAGEVSLRLELEGYEPKQVRGTALAGRETSLTATLTRLLPTPATASKELPFENTLGMRFVPAGTPSVLFCIWETRVRDYAVYANANPSLEGSWQNPGYGQDVDHPVVNVSWEDAVGFCAWLTKKERDEGRIGLGDQYRLPSKEEWEGAGGARTYPWGNQWPPPVGAGNYGSALNVDRFEWTSPVGSFSPNEWGLYDMGGNIWEWCEKIYESGEAWCVLRGGSWYDGDEMFLRSARRSVVLPVRRDNDDGFRCVLSVSGSPAR